MGLSTELNLQTFETNGFAVIPNVFPEVTCHQVLEHVGANPAGSAGTRSLLATAWCQHLAQALRSHPLLAAFVPSNHVAVQCTYFEKSPERNWLVPIHQDRSIPVASRVEHPELQGWSEKEGALFVQPPVQLLEQLVAVRVHLDPCGANDGPLRVVPGSHRIGTIDSENAARVRESNGEVICEVPCGGALVIRPSLLHASSKSTGRNLRRVLHFLYGPPDLPFGLRWQSAV